MQLSTGAPVTFHNVPSTGYAKGGGSFKSSVGKKEKEGLWSGENEEFAGGTRTQCLSEVSKLKYIGRLSCLGKARGAINGGGLLGSLLGVVLRKNRIKTAPEKKLGGNISEWRQGDSKMRYNLYNRW